MKFPLPSRKTLWRHKWRILIAAIIILPIVGVVVIAVRPSQPEYITAIADRTDLIQTVEAVGTVTSDRDLELQFPTSSVVAQVFVKEGDAVRAGQRLAMLRNGTQAAAVASASALLQSEQARLREMEQGSRPEDLAVTEADVASKRTSLSAAKTTLETAGSQLDASEEKLKTLRAEAQVGLAGNVATTRSSISQQLAVVQVALRVIDDVFDDPSVQDVIIKFNPGGVNDVRIDKTKAESHLSSALLQSQRVIDFEQALAALDQARAASAESVAVLQRAYDTISLLPETSSYTIGERETHKSTLSTQKGYVDSAIASLDASSKELRDASATYNTRIAAEEAILASAKGSHDKAESDIATYEAAVAIAEAQLRLKRAGERPETIDAQRARVRQAQADLQRASASYSDTVLTAPVDGIITKVHVKTGEFTPAGPAVTLLGNSPYRIEMFTSEIDIPRVQLSQSGSIELDAFPNVHMKLRVSEVDPASTEVDGVSKYRVVLDFVHLHDELKIGMTGDTEIVTGMRSDVVTVPRRAVIEEGTGSIVRVLVDGDIEKRPVITGMEGAGGDMEVTGIEEGEMVIVLIKE